MEQEAERKTESKKENQFASVHVRGRAELLSGPAGGGGGRAAGGRRRLQRRLPVTRLQTLATNPRHSREAELPAISQNIEHIHLFN